MFVDPSVPDLQQIMSGISADHELILLNADQDAIAQITQVLSHKRDVQSIHLIAHGESGQIQLGNNIVDEAALVDAQDRLRTWRDSLTSNADILIYACNTGHGEMGQQFMRRLAGLTGADVAASDDATGSSLKGGDWILEQSVGQIDSALAVNALRAQTIRICFADHDSRSRNDQSRDHGTAD